MAYVFAKKLKDLTRYLLDFRQCSSDQLFPWMENADLELTSSINGDGLVIGRIRYTAVFSIEKFSKDEALLFALVSAWLQENDPDRDRHELKSPKLDIEDANAKTADVEIEIEFLEDITVVPDVDGLIEFNGQRWSIAQTTIDEATSVAVGDNEALPTDAEYPGTS